MHIIVCLDKSKGMLFNNRRQSKDQNLTSKITELTIGKRLLMNEYSAPLFLDSTDIIVDNDFISKANSGDFCFIENEEIPQEKIEDIYIFNWNRDYPADKYFDFDLITNGYKLYEKTEFAGNSHKKITLEILKRA